MIRTLGNCPMAYDMLIPDQSYLTLFCFCVLSVTFNHDSHFSKVQLQYIHDGLVSRWIMIRRGVNPVAGRLNHLSGLDSQ
jgi:hypothetical protein